MKSTGESIVRSAKQALQWVTGEDVPGVKVTTVMVPETDVRVTGSKAETAPMAQHESCSPLLTGIRRL